MTDNPKAAWPKTPDGTIDWEAVFEDPHAGLVPLVERTQSVEALRQAGEAIFQKLFTRKNDADLRHQMITRVHDITAEGDDVAAMTAEVVDLMRQVKDERIEKARVYVERKQAGAAIDRRAGLFWKIDRFLSPKVLIPVGGLAVALLSGLVYLSLSATLGPGPVATKKAEQRAGAGGTASGEDGEAAEGDYIREGTPFPIWLKTIRWPLSPEDPAPPRYYAVIPYVTNMDDKIEFCRLLPKVMDRIHLALDSTMPKDRVPRVDEMPVIHEAMLEELNAVMPDEFIVDVVVARYGTAEFKVSTIPPFCKSPPVASQ